jgi:quaternary ammonium compound-resistance protein SugE
MSWILLIIAGLCEIGFVTCLGKARNVGGSVAYMWYTGFIAFLGLSMFLLMKATQVLPLGTAYAVWTGIGAAGSVLVGILIFKEPVDFWRIFFLFTLIISLIGLNLVTPVKGN